MCRGPNRLDYEDTDLHSYEHGWLVARGRPALPPEGNVCGGVIELT